MAPVEQWHSPPVPAGISPAELLERNGPNGTGETWAEMNDRDILAISDYTGITPWDVSQMPYRVAMQVLPLARDARAMREYAVDARSGPVWWAQRVLVLAIVIACGRWFPHSYEAGLLAGILIWLLPPISRPLWVAMYREGLDWWLVYRKRKSTNRALRRWNR